ncbi:hypothetical protein BE15_09660 [Sorangium cellulosum]|uniref:Uncharacterized protein n=1 Tax=Sorangium cellulosum TaxID=56 RepID=A0A150R0W3_SORCE|nr:hypothetical protein BE15_09660 [Sorangium cellulosum]
MIPRYRAPGDAPWYHVLHGNIPGHQIDFMYCPEVPQGPLTTTHFSHLARLMKYIEPATGATHAFAIGNLSRDDTQHEPGHGAVGLIFGFRIGGTVDHAGRGNPPFAHGLVAVDRDLGYATLLEASATFYRHVMNATEVNSSAGMFYREYVAAVRDAPERVAHVLERYVEEYGDLPYLRRSSATWDWKVDDGAAPKRVVIVHKHDEPFGAIAHAAARIATVLYRSNIKWTSITSGREADIPGGVSVRFVRERDVTMEERHGVLLRIEDVSEDEGEIARGMFGARPQGEQEEKPQFGGWRERFAAQQGGTGPLGSPAHGAAGAMPGVALHERERRAAGSAPPSQRAAGVRWNDAPGRAGGGLAEAGAGAAGLGMTAASGPASQQVGPKGTLVIDTEKLLGGVARSAALSAAVEAGHTGPLRMGQPAGGAAGQAASGAWGAAPLPPLPGGGAGEERDEIPVIVEKPAASRKWIWAVAGLGLAAAAGAAAVLVSQRVPGVGPAVPDATGADVVVPPSAGSAAPPEPSAEASAAATGAPSATALPSPWSPPAETAKPQAGQEQPQQDEPQPKTQSTGRTRNPKAGGAATGRFEPKPRGGKVPASSTAEPPLPEGKPDF